MPHHGAMRRHGVGGCGCEVLKWFGFQVQSSRAQVTKPDFAVVAEAWWEVARVAAEHLRGPTTGVSGRAAQVGFLAVRGRGGEGGFHFDIVCMLYTGIHRGPGTRTIVNMQAEAEFPRQVSNVC